MPKISYQEIVTADVSESGTVSHEFEYYNSILTHSVDGVIVNRLIGEYARKEWIILCRSKKYQTSERDLSEKKNQKSKSKSNLNSIEKLTINLCGTSQLTMEFQ